MRVGPCGSLTKPISERAIYVDRRRNYFFYLDDLAFSAEHEPEHHLPLLVIDVSELHTDRRVAHPPHNRIDDRHAKVGEHQDGRSKSLAIVEAVEVVRREEAGSAGSELIDHRVDVHCVDAEEQVHGLGGAYRQSENGALFTVVGGLALHNCYFGAFG